jgi:hypothetical protein
MAARALHVNEELMEALRQLVIHDEEIKQGLSHPQA